MENILDKIIAEEEILLMFLENPQLTWTDIFMKYKVSIVVIHKYSKDFKAKDWNVCIQTQDLPLFFLQKNKGKFDAKCWSLIATNYKLSNTFIEENKDDLLKNNIIETFIKNQKLLESFVEKYLIKISKGAIQNTLINYQNFSKEFIIKHEFFFMKKNNLRTSLLHQDIPEEIIEKYKNTFSEDDWLAVYYSQHISSNFILNNIDKSRRYLKTIARHQTLTEDFVKDNYMIFDKEGIELINMFQKNISKELKEKILSKYII